MTRPVALIILDGWGYRAAVEGNAVAQARTPIFDRLWKDHAHTFLNTTGLAVGLPDGVMGNSEVGHMNIGAGRVVFQNLTRIHESIRAKTFAQIPPLQQLFASVNAGATLHLMGLLSDGGVHSHIDHLFALMDAAQAAGIARVCVHPFLDGRDTSPTNGIMYLAQLQEHCAALGNATIATVSGRYYAMDRDQRWERTKLAYDALVHGNGEQITDPIRAVTASYENNLTDEFVVPKVVIVEGKPVGCLCAGDAVCFFNYRGDRARQMVQALGAADFADFARRGAPVFRALTCMAQYHQAYDYPVLFAPMSMQQLCGHVVSAHGLKQLRIAETEKYAHVTFFFNGGEDAPSPGEEHCLIQSPKDVATYDQKPAMSAPEVTAELLRRIEKNTYDLIILNFANPDMVGHTGVVSAAVEAVETVDHCLGEVMHAIRAHGGAAVVTADHGNCEEMRTADGKPHTAHTTNPVPCMLVSAQHADVTLRDGGTLADLAPTLLELLGIAQPKEMTGKSLMES